MLRRCTSTVLLLCSKIRVAVIAVVAALPHITECTPRQEADVVIVLVRFCKRRNSAGAGSLMCPLQMRNVLATFEGVCRVQGLY